MNIIHILAITGGENVNIKHIREKKNFSQNQLADLVGVDRSAIAKWETGKAKPTADNLLKLAEVLDCSIDELLR